MVKKSPLCIFELGCKFTVYVQSNALPTGVTTGGLTTIIVAPAVSAKIAHSDATSTGSLFTGPVLPGRARKRIRAQYCAVDSVPRFPRRIRTRKSNAFALQFQMVIFKGNVSGNRHGSSARTRRAQTRLRDSCEQPVCPRLELAAFD